MSHNIALVISFSLKFATVQ